MAARSPPRKVSRTDPPAPKQNEEDTVDDLVARLGRLRSEENIRPPNTSSNRRPPIPVLSRSASSVDSLHAPTSKAPPRDVFSSQSPTPRYGHQSESSASSSNQQADTDDPDALEREWTRAHRALDLMEVTSLWQQLDNPTADGDMAIDSQL